MKQTVPNISRNLNLPSKAGSGYTNRKSGSPLKTKFILSLLGAFLSLASTAQTYTTKAAGDWNSANTWVGGLVPGSTIAAGQTVTVKHAVQYSQQTALTISGTLNITADTLRFDGNFNKGVTVQATGVLNVSNGGFIQDVTANKSDLQINGKLVASNAKIAVSKGLSAAAGSKTTFVNSTVLICEKYTVDGSSASPSVDTIKSSTVQVALNHDGDFEIKDYVTLSVANAKITVGNGSFKTASNSSVKVLTGATNNYGFNLIKTSKDLKNDGAWDARIDAYCVSGNVNGSNASAIDFTRPEDCSTTTTTTPAPELSFTNPVLKSGTDKKQGAVYRFTNVTPGVDAEIKLKKFSRSDIVMNSVDNSTLGWNKAFQPEFGLPGVVAPYQNWYVDFTITFYEAGSNKKTKVQRADFTALDVDGDGYSIAEYASFNNPSSVAYSTFSSLATSPAGSLGSSMKCSVCGVTSVLTQCLLCHGTGEVATLDCAACNGTGVLYSACNHSFDGIIGNVLQGPIQNYTNIDTSGTAVMATFQYVNVDHIDFRYGATSSAGASNGSGIRLNSMWSKSFNLAPVQVLPVQFSAFSVYNQKGDAVINWETPNHEDLAYFVVQRSTDGKQFSDIATVFSGDMTAYSYKDKNISSPTGVVYYRVVSVDQTKDTKLSEVKLIRLTKTETASASIATFPNPVVNNVNVSLPASWQGKAVSFEVYRTDGSLVKKTQTAAASQTETIQLAGLVKGTYVVKAAYGTESATQRIVKN